MKDEAELARVHLALTTPFTPTLKDTIGLVLHGVRKDPLLSALRFMSSLETDEERIVALLLRLVRETGRSIEDLRSLGYEEQVLSALERLLYREKEGPKELVERAAQKELSRNVLVADAEERSGRRRLSLTTERLFMRELESADWPDVHRYAGDPRVVEYLDWGPNTEEKTRRDVEASIGRRNSVPRLDLFLAATTKEGGTLIGGCGLGLSRENPTTASLGFLFSRDFWGKGYATESASRLVAYGFDELRLHRIGATCDALNQASCHVLEKLGMAREGHLRSDRYKDGRFHDTFVYGVLADEFRASHPLP